MFPRLQLLHSDCSSFISAFHTFHDQQLSEPALWNSGKVTQNLISWLQSPSAVIMDPKKIKSDTVSPVSPSICHEVMGPDAMIFIFSMLSFKPNFSLSSFTFIKRLFSSSSLSAIRVVSSAYLRLLILLPAILIPACASSSLAFHMMYST